MDQTYLISPFRKRNPRSTVILTSSTVGVFEADIVAAQAIGGCSYPADRQDSTSMRNARQKRNFQSLGVAHHNRRQTLSNMTVGMDASTPRLRSQKVADALNDEGQCCLFNIRGLPCSKRDTRRLTWLYFRASGALECIDRTPLVEVLVPSSDTA